MTILTNNADQITELTLRLFFLFFCFFAAYYYELNNKNLKKKASCFGIFPCLFPQTQCANELTPRTIFWAACYKIKRPKSSLRII